MNMSGAIFPLVPLIPLGQPEKNKQNTLKEALGYLRAIPLEVEFKSPPRHFLAILSQSHLESLSLMQNKIYFNILKIFTEY